jgi:hypothetical protein
VKLRKKLICFYSICFVFFNVGSIPFSREKNLFCLYLICFVLFCLLESGKNSILSMKSFFVYGQFVLLCFLESENNFRRGKFCCLYLISFVFWLFFFKSFGFCFDLNRLVLYSYFMLDHQNFESFFASDCCFHYSIFIQFITGCHLSFVASRAQREYTNIG